MFDFRRGSTEGQNTDGCWVLCNRDITSTRSHGGPGLLLTQSGNAGVDKQYRSSLGGCSVPSLVQKQCLLERVAQLWQWL